MKEKCIKRTGIEERQEGGEGRIEVNGRNQNNEYQHKKHCSTGTENEYQKVMFRKKKSMASK